MLKVEFFDPAERLKEKERSRVSDAYALENAYVSREELAQRNGFFAQLDVVESSIGSQGFFL